VRAAQRGAAERSSTVEAHGVSERFRLETDYEPRGDQPGAIDELVRGIERGDRHQTLLGVTGRPSPSPAPWSA